MWLRSGTGSDAAEQENQDRQFVNTFHLSPHHQYFKLPRFCGGKVEAFGYRIERHSLRPRGSPNSVDGGVQVGRTLVKDADRTVAVGEEYKASIGIERRSVDVITNRKRLDYFPGISIHNSRHFAATTDEQAPILAVHGHGGGSLAGIQRPLVEYLQLLRVDDHNLVLLLEIHENLAGAIGCGE